MQSIVDPVLIRSLAPMRGLIDAVAEAFRGGCDVPARTIASVPGAAGRLLISMPAFDRSGAGVVKLATVYPDNNAVGLPTVQATIVVFSANGTPEAVLDGTIVTKLRTGAASALASRYLSRPDSSHLVVIGTGELAPVMALAHCVTRPIKRISIWGRNLERAAAAQRVVESLVDGVDVTVATSLEAAVRTADIVTCATTSPAPVLAGKWLRPGTFVDLVGSFSPSTREADDDVVRRSRIFVDTRDGAFTEAGDLLDPLQRGVIEPERIEGALSDLVLGRSKGRVHAEEITLFKSVGTAIEDLAAARMIVDGHKRTVRNC